jgi:hypothetical protein
MTSHIDLGDALKPLPTEIASDLVSEFLEMRRDVMSRNLGRSSPGKFVETLVQALQFMERGSYDKRPSVDSYLKGLESSGSGLDDGLRICAARIGRSMYTLRNKRAIAHKGDLDPSRYDLAYLHHAAQWIMSELIRVLSGSSMDSAGELVEQIQAPVGGLVEDHGDRRIVLADLTILQEVLVLLHSHYPEPVPMVDVKASLSRRNERSVRRTVHEAWERKLVERYDGGALKLTAKGVEHAISILAEGASLGARAPVG